MKLTALNEGLYYHGTKATFDRFEYAFIGQGHDQEGPGFYFTSSEADARHYLGPQGRVIHAAIDLKKPVPLKGRAKVAELRKMLKAAPDLADILTDWDENPRVAFEKALRIISDQPSPHQAFQSVWYDFYRGREAEYLRNMKTLLGYDGVIIPSANGITHIVVFSPDDIHIQ